MVEEAKPVERTVKDVEGDLDAVSREMELCRRAEEQANYQAALAAWRLNVLQAMQFELNKELAKFREVVK